MSEEQKYERAHKSIYLAHKFERLPKHLADEHGHRGELAGAGVL